MQIISDYEVEYDPFVYISGEKMGLTLPSEIHQVLVTPAASAAASPMSLTEARPPPRKARTKNCLPLSARYVHEGCRMLLV
jgi:hypothetical protein